MSKQQCQIQSTVAQNGPKYRKKKGQKANRRGKCRRLKCWYFLAAIQKGTALTCLVENENAIYSHKTWNLKNRNFHSLIEEEESSRKKWFYGRSHWERRIFWVWSELTSCSWGFSESSLVQSIPGFVILLKGILLFELDLLLISNDTLGLVLIGVYNLSIRLLEKYRDMQFNSIWYWSLYSAKVRDRERGKWKFSIWKKQFCN